MQHHQQPLAAPSLSLVARKSWEDDRALRANGVGGLGALAWKNLSKLPQFVRR
jgi:glycosyltransferase